MSAARPPSGRSSSGYHLEKLFLYDLADGIQLLKNPCLNRKKKRCHHHCPVHSLNNTHLLFFFSSVEKKPPMRFDLASHFLKSSPNKNETLPSFGQQDSQSGKTQMKYCPVGWAWNTLPVFLA